MKNMFIKVLSVVMALTMIMGAFGTIALAADAACDHEWVKGETVAPTCTTKGYTVYTCDKCDSSVNGDEVPALGTSGHKFEWTEAQEKTCTQDGKAAGNVCTLCGYDERVITEVSTGHTWGGITWTDKDASEVVCGKIEVYQPCTADGCDAKNVLHTIDNNSNTPTYDSNGNPMGLTHPSECDYQYSFEDTEDLPTCIEAGVMVYKCTYCANIKVVITGDAPLDHDFDWDDNGSKDTDGEGYDHKDATCDAPGYTKNICEACGYVENTDHKALGHNWDKTGDGKVDANDLYGTAPTCKDEGTLRYECQRCDATSTDGLNNNKTECTSWADITANHDCVFKYNNEKIASGDLLNAVLKFSEAATCYSAGYQWQHCTVCDNIRKNPIPQKTECSWVEDTDWTYNGDNVNDPCHATGIKYKVCSDCGAREISQVSTPNHPWTTDATTGKTVWYTDANSWCDDCDTNHNCVDAIVYYRQCSECGFKDYEHTDATDAPANSAAKDHGDDWYNPAKWEYIEYEGNDKAPCDPTAANYYLRKCEDCCATERVILNTRPHSNEVVYDCDDPNCTEYACDDCTHEGRKALCKDCKAVVDADEKYTHNHVQGKDEADKLHDAFCGGPAEWNFYCQNPGCADVEVRGVGEADAENHDKYDYDEDGRIFEVKQTDPSSCTSAGMEYGICFECGGAANEVTRPLPKAAHKYDKVAAAKVEATCTETGTEEVKECTVCGHQIGGEVIAALGHTEEKISDAVLPTCSASGHTEGVKCGVCNEVLEPQETLPAITRDDEAWNDPARHFVQNGAAITTVYTVDPTCMHGTLTYNKYGTEADHKAGNACGHIIREENGNKNIFNHVEYIYEDADGDGIWTLSSTPSLLKDAVALKGATCTANGTHGYQYCGGCDVITSVTVSGCNNGEAITANQVCTTKSHTDLLNYAQYDADGDDVLEAGDRAGTKFADVDDSKWVIAALGHNFVRDSLKVFPTCTVAGVEEVWSCNRSFEGVDCDVVHDVYNGEELKAHGEQHNASNYFELEAVAHTCTQNGTYAGQYCTICVATKAEAEAYYAAAGQAFTYTCAGCDSDVRPDYVDYTDGHTPYTVYTSVKDCDTHGYVVRKCQECDATHAEVGEIIKGVNGNKPLTTRTALWFFQDFEAAGHYYKKLNATNGKREIVYETIPATCDEPAKIVMVCQADNCGHKEFVEYVEGSTALGHSVELGCTAVQNGCTNNGCGLTEVHNYITITTNGKGMPGYDCSKDTVITVSCEDCGKVESTRTIAATGHTKYAGTVSYTVADGFKPGAWVWTCADCGMDVSTPIVASRDIVLDITVNPYIAGKDAADLTFVNGGLIEVTVAITLDETVVNGFNYQLNYNDNKFEFVGGELVYDKFINDGEYKAMDKVHLDDNGNNVKVSAFYYENATATMSGENVAFVKLIFKVAPTVTTIVAGDFSHGALVFNNDAALNDNIPYSVTRNSISEAVTLKLMGDMNNDGAYNIADMTAIMAIVRGSEKYNNVADINNDGEVNSSDYASVAKYINKSNGTVADYYAMFGYDIVAILDGFDYADYNDVGVDKAALVAALTAKNANVDADWTKTLAVGYYNKLLEDLADELLATNP